MSIVNLPVKINVPPGQENEENILFATKIQRKISNSCTKLYQIVFWILEKRKALHSISHEELS
ncbi:MAG: hypothetical protein RR642_13860 [Solibacillus sp.]